MFASEKLFKTADIAYQFFVSTCRINRLRHIIKRYQICLNQIRLFLQMDIQNSSEFANLGQYTPNGEWKLLERVKLIRHIKHYPNVPNVPFPEIIVTFKLRRKTLYYMWVKLWFSYRPFVKSLWWTLLFLMLIKGYEMNSRNWS